jgi:hypothetical protein
LQAVFGKGVGKGKRKNGGEDSFSTELQRSIVNPMHLKMAMAKTLPRHVICVPGNWHDLGEVDAIIRQQSAPGFELDREFSQLAPDSRMRASFDASYVRIRPSMTEEDWQAVQGHTAVAYVLSPPIPKAQAAGISGLALQLTAALLLGGGVAAKGESAGIAHGRARWLELAADFARARKRGDTVAEGASLYWAWVRRPLLSKAEAVYYSCGMHLLGERDIEIESSLALGPALEWTDLLGLYLVGDRPRRPLKDGEGFRLKDAGPRRVMRFSPCKRYEADGFMFNPYGYIRLEPDKLD